MTGFVTPYFVGSAILLTINLFHRRATVWHRETITSYVLVVPASMAYYLTAFLIPCFGYNNLWQVNIVTIVAESALFFILVVRGNAFGLFYYQRNATREQMGKSIIEGTGVLQHAMKNNLLAVRLALQNAQYRYNKDKKDSEAIMNDIQLAFNSCEHSLSILERIHLKIHPVQLAPKNCTLLPIIEEVIDQSQTEYADKNVQIVREFNSNPHVYCDPVHIREVILNLVNNAIEATCEDGFGRLTISLKEVKGKVILKISDNGGGIGKDQIKRLGIPLLTQKSEGTHYGLGLYYVKKVIGMHDGQFSLRKAKNGGMTAKVTLSAIREKKQ
jgi:signal transduction histidine kinase